MSKEQTFLQLSPEFGGTKFGPFEGVEVRLGSDPTRNDIVLPETLGVAPEHVKVLKQQDGSFIVAPTERTATIYLWRSDGRPPKHITTPTAIAAGDAFSLVTAEGPRFYVLSEVMRGGAGAGDIQAPPKRGKKKDSMGEGIFKEIKRMGFAKVFTTKIGQFAMTAWTMIKTGTIFSPRYIVMGLMMLIPMVTALFAGGLAVFAFGQSAKKDKEIEEIKGDLALCDPTGGQQDPTFTSLTQSILGDREWEQSLSTDPTFLQAYQKRLKLLFARADRYAWVYKRKTSDFVTFKTRLEKEMPEGLARVFAYLAAQEGYVADREWELIKADSDSKETCGRGAAIMTFRQAVNLKITAQPDALVDSSYGDASKEEERKTAIKSALDAVDDPRQFEAAEITTDGASVQGGFLCISLAGDDYRTDYTELAKGLGDALGARADKVPGENADYWITARLMRYYAADFRYGFDELDFSTEVPTVALASASPDQQTFAIEQAADTLARAVAIPCLALLEKTEAPHMGAPPSLMQCGVLRFLVDYELQ